MGLIVLALRSYLVFQNIYQTFKTLKLPPPSARNNGRPSVRAMSQRKRDMKGCMTIWIVWCCLATYEAWVEGFVSIFIPFYDEIKCIILVFFILSRARGAEPIYLHLIRPLLKPYVPALDAILDIVHNLGDFILLVASVPLYPILSWWHGNAPDQPDVALTEVASDDGYSVANELVHANGRPDAPLHSHSDGILRTRSAAPPPAPGAQDALASRFYAPPQQPSAVTHEFWQPPPSSYEEDDLPRMEMPVPQIPANTATDVYGDEWRRYPAFPAAYPPTPLPPSRTDPRPLTNALQFIPEGDLVYERNTEGSTSPIEGDEQGFGGSLLPPREPMNPGSDGDMSDDIHNLGVQHDTETTLSNETDDDDDDYIDEEDTFDITLRTPPVYISLPVARARSNMSIATVATVASSGSSIETEPTVLTTVGHSSSLRTRTNSQASSTSASESSNVAGKKRSWSRSNLQTRTPIRAGRKPTLRNSARRPAPMLRNAPSKSSSMQTNYDGTTSDEVMDDVSQGTRSSGDDEVPAAPKRRRIGTTPRATKGVRTARPVPVRKAAEEVPQAARTRASVKHSIPNGTSRSVATRTSLRAAARVSKPAGLTNELAAAPVSRASAAKRTTNQGGRGRGKARPRI